MYNFNQVMVIIKAPDRTEKWKPKLHIKRKLIIFYNTTIPNLSVFIVHLESISLKRWSNLNQAIPPKYSKSYPYFEVAGDDVKEC